MESLTELSRSVFQSTEKFASPSPKRRFEAFEITVINRVSYFKRSEVAEADLAHWGSVDAVEPAGTSSPAASPAEVSLKMLCVERNLDVSLNVSKNGFNGLLNGIKPHPAVFYLVCRDYDGFHEFPGGSDYLRTWFFGASIHAILWTFDDTVSPTRIVAIYFRRRLNVFTSFGDVLRAFGSHTHAWQTMLLAIAVHSIQWFDDNYELNKIRHVERLTGFGPRQEFAPGRTGLDIRNGKVSYFSASNFDIDTLMESSQGVNEVAGQLSNKLRHLRVVRSMVERLKTDAANLRGRSSVHHESNMLVAESLRILDTAVPTITDRLTTYAEYLAYLRDRSERLSAVLFALLTHQDAAAAIDLGVASRRDTSSMKTIAIVTMSFLPATFLAALFAMPSLDWDGEKVISPHFWVYWAFTIPTTAFVFGVWLAVTERHRLIRWFTVFRSNRRQRSTDLRNLQ